MAFDYRTVLNWRIPDAEQRLRRRDTMLYALGIGMGEDPADERELQFVYEENLRAFPSMAAVLAHPGFWMKEPGTGIDWAHVLHAEQSIRLHRPLPVEGVLRSRSRVNEIVDKGPDKGALVYQDREIFMADTAEPVATVELVGFCRRDGGCGAPTATARVPIALPQRLPDATDEKASLPQSALIYRLSGDYNPLHADPAIARKAGFDRPILHGLCTLGIALRSVIGTRLGYRTDLVRGIDVRFAAPVFPGETIRTDIWDDGRILHFRSFVPSRDVLVLTNGRVSLEE